MNNKVGKFSVWSVSWEYLMEARRVKELALRIPKGFRLRALFKSRSGETKVVYYCNPKDIPEFIQDGETIFYLWSVRREAGERAPSERNPPHVRLW